MADEKHWTSTDKIESLAAEQSKADPSGQPAPDEAPPVGRDVLSIAREGLSPRSGKRKKVLVIGAGMAGLVAAYELKRQGHEPLVLEAQSRVGGRIYTLRAPFAPGLYAEAGGMRIPRAHDLTLAYCELFGLPMRPFVMGNPRRPRAPRRPADDHGGGGRASRAAAVRPRRPRARPHRRRAVGGGHRATCGRWSSARDRGLGPDRRASTTSTRSTSSCATRAGRAGAIEYFTVVNFLEADMHNSLVEILREDLGGAYEDMQEIAGGMDGLPNAFYAAPAGRRSGSGPRCSRSTRTPTG